MQEWSVPEVVSAIAGAAAVIYTFVSDRRKANSGKVRELEQKIDAKAGGVELTALAGRIQLAEHSLTRIQTEMRHMPDHNTTSRIEIALEKLSGKVGALDEKLKPVSAMADRIQEAMMERVSKL